MLTVEKKKSKKKIKITQWRRPLLTVFCQFPPRLSVGKHSRRVPAANLLRTRPPNRDKEIYSITRNHLPTCRMRTRRWGAGGAAGGERGEGEPQVPPQAEVMSLAHAQ